MDVDRDLVGLDVVKEWADAFLKECLQYLAAGGGRNETRHILLTGSIGTGKRRAAELIAKCLHATGHFDTEAFREGKQDPKARTLFYEETKWSGVVDERLLQEYGGVTIVSCRDPKALAKSTGGFEAFIKREVNYFTLLRMMLRY